MNEVQRQQAFVAMLASPQAAAPSLPWRESGERAARGLSAYRANAQASADRALAAAFPTVRALVGEEDFAHLAAEFWGAQPPLRGDLGEWGGAFPAWLEAHTAMAPWPYLGDCARLDFALHCSERAADAVLDAASLTQLESTDPVRLRIELMPGSALLRSAWPIASIHAAHQLLGEAAERAFERVREAIAAARGEQVLVARSGWRAVVYPLDAATADWTEQVLAGASLEAALEAAGASFDFAAWLASALRESWLKGVVVSRD
jgi:Putative DNA-binding domain